MFSTYIRRIATSEFSYSSAIKSFLRFNFSDLLSQQKTLEIAYVAGPITNEA